MHCDTKFLLQIPYGNFYKICNDDFGMGMPSQRISPKIIATPNYNKYLQNYYTGWTRLIRT